MNIGMTGQKKMDFILLILLPIECLFFYSIKTGIIVTILTLFEMYQVSIKEFVRGLGLTSVYMISGFINSIVQILSCVLFVYVFNLGITGYILSITIAFAFEIGYCASKVIIREYLCISYISKAVLRDMIKYCFPLVPNKIMWWVVSASDRYFILFLY